jgi:predicted  nucleic acid-binding Zn-ribbon protein
MNKRQKKLRREHLKYMKKLREISDLQHYCDEPIEHPNFIKSNVDDLMADEQKKHLREFNYEN